MQLTEQELNYKLASSPKPRVTEEYINSRISSTTFDTVFETVTICNIMLDNGYSVRGESACVNKENFNKDIGETLAFKNAYSKLWTLFGFLLAETTMINTPVKVA